ncbi:transcriptional regulator, ArsR family [Xylanimonas cellulosilytica DSM 15894]|uniref:Transcriptional regulator, ArsR family n=1 Tax=Xylanimonas cellulosilytica (strain DSM 15894 / JCM 12276 / CECT 5975 / KCTC 9989 / LMG 20990 / NBRC 107835 / XIL07) TaxID=446471 RepID=D1BRS7_XYLCX|nr:helix-turn-helix domain-containing protein [Xylanimonas cellulosilytica]ACZ32343.1 transcriptional regulator, ArsR family [Xylanimonas cellulosilytica DSM 15894]
MDQKVEFRLTPGDAQAVRFGISPGHELVHAIRALARPVDHPLQWAWLRASRDRAPRPAFTLLRLVVGESGYLPDFLTPPAGWTASADDERERIAAADPDRVTVDLGKRAARTAGAESRTLAELAQHPAEALRAVVEAWQTCWEALLAPWWPRIERVLQADVNARSRRAALEGVGAMAAGLHHDVGWSADTVTVRLTAHDEVVDCGGRGLLLVPSVFADRCFVLTEAPSVPSIFYPALGVTAEWADGSARRADALAAVVGSGRASLLHVLATPSSTTEAARAAGLAISTASHHLGALRAAGLVDSRRDGARVEHVRTPLGEALVRG